MVPAHELALFAATAFLLALSPGPNMVYLVSRAICQGRVAGVVSLLGVVSGMVVYVTLTAFGLSAVFLAVPLAYDLLRFAGATYLLYLAWQAFRPRNSHLIQPTALAPESNRRMFTVGLLTCLLNPKVMVFYVSLLPQFIAPERGSVLAQSVVLGLTQVLMAFCAHFCVTLSAAQVSRWLVSRPRWLSFQRYLLGSVLTGLAVRLALENRRAA